MILPWLIPPTLALNISEVDRSTVADGVEVVQLRTTDPDTDAWLAEIDLCAEGIRIDATRTPDSTQSTSSWGSDVGAILAVNGDFYQTSPVRVYGDAVGSGVAWPTDQTGTDSGYSWEWFYGDYGWLAFRPERVTFTHSGWTKDNAETLGVSGGWEPDTRIPSHPGDTLALVSGFPALVIEGAAMVCSDPEDSDCFPDRSDMRDRHPRTAMGITEDAQTLLLVVVDGRSSDSDGMYGSELADLMGQLSAWQAFNLDGGGSSTFWTAEGSVLNEPSDGSARSVANHLGVFSAPNTGDSTRAWHCSSAEPCDEIPVGGGVLDEAGDCFQAHGPAEWWREVAGDGDGGSLVWTNQFESDQPSNWAWWRLHFAESGTYEVSWHGSAEYSVAGEVRHRLVAGGVEHEIEVDQGAGDGWHSLGTFDFDSGGEQFLAIDDDLDGDVASDQHIVFDAIQLVRVGAWCGDGSCDSGEDYVSCPGDCAESGGTGGSGGSGGSGSSGTGGVDTADESTDEGPGGCGGSGRVIPGDEAGCGGCTSAALRVGIGGLLPGLAGLRRRRFALT